MLTWLINEDILHRKLNETNLFKVVLTSIVLGVILLYTSHESDLCAQPVGPDFEWNFDLTHSNDESIVDIAVDGAGNSYCLLEFSGNIEFDLAYPQTWYSGGSQDLLLVKYSDEGKVLAVVQFSSISDVRGGGLTLDAAGNVYITGSFDDNTLTIYGDDNTVTVPNNANSDAFIAKINTNEDVVWAQNPNGSGEEAGVDIVCDGTDLYVIGTYQNTLYLSGGNTETAVHGTDTFIASYDLNGIFSWSQSIGGTNTQYGTAIAEYGGQLFACGAAFSNITFTGSPDITDSTIGFSDYWVAGFSKVDGQVNWAKTSEGPALEEARGITADASSVYITGQHYGMTVDGNTVTSNGLSDCFVIEYDLNGNLLDYWSEGGSGWDGGNDLVVDVDGELFVIGSYSGTVTFGGIETATAAGSIDVFIVKYDPTNAIEWLSTIESNNLILSNTIAVNANQRLVGGGYFIGADLRLNLPSGVETQYYDGGEDLWLAFHNDCALSPTSNTFTATSEVICSGSTPAVIDGIAASGGDGSYTYLWERSPDGGNSWENAPGVNNTEDYSPSAINRTYHYRRTVESGCTTRNYGDDYVVWAEPGLPAWDAPASICVSDPVLDLSTTVSDSKFGDAQEITFESGVPTAFKILGYQDGRGASFFHSGDLAVIDMVDTIPAGTAYYITWKQKQSTPGSSQIDIFESVDGISFVQNSVSPSTTTESYFIEAVVAENPTRYIRLEHVSKAFEIDAITYIIEPSTDGTWSGAGVSGTQFDPSVAGIGTHPITYTTGLPGCEQDSTRSLAVGTGVNPGTANSSASSVCPGNNVTLTLTGSTGDIQWEISTDGTNWNDVVGETSASFVDSPVVNTSYRAMVSDPSCGSMASNEVLVSITSEDPSFSYNSSVYCEDDTDPTPTITGDSGGTFTEATGNVILTNSSTGEIDLSLSVPGGPYSIVYTTPGGCSSSSFDVTIEQRDDASFSYSSNSFCSTDANPIATITGTSGGIFSCSSLNVVFSDNTTGEVDLSLSTSGGPYTITYTTSGVCPNSSTFDITIVDEDIANAGIDQTNLACGTTSTTLLATTPTSGTGTWSIQSGIGGSIGSANDPNSTFSGNAGESYVLRWTISNLPCADNYDEVTISFPSVAVTANAGPDQTGATMCNLTSTTLAANDPFPGSGTWSIISGTGGSFADPTDPTTTFTGITEQTYVLEWTVDQAPCPSSSDTVTIDFPHNPSGAYAGTDKVGNSMCGVTSVTMNASSPAYGSGTWSVISGVGGSFDDTSSNTAIFSGNSGETYTLRWTVSNPPCGSTMDEITVEFLPVPTPANAGSDQIGATLCGMTSTTLDGNTPTSGIGTWTILSGIGGAFTNVNDPNTTFTGVAGETYELLWTISTGYCTDSSDSVWIEFAQNPSAANAGADIIDDTLCGLTEVTLDGNSPTTGIGSWTIESGTGGVITNSNDPNSLFSGVAGEMYNLRWTISNPPCADSFDEVTIYFPENPTVANAGSDQTDASMCGITSTFLSANTPVTGIGTWSVISGIGGTFDNANDPNTLFSGVAEETYILRWTISNPPCMDSFDDVNISFYGLPTPANAGPDQIDGSLCGLTATSLNANTPTTGIGEWSIVSGSGGNISDIYNSNSAFSGIAGEHYILKWTISTTNCGSTEDQVEVWFGQEATPASAGPNQNGTSMCGLTTTILEANTPAIGSGLWTVESGIGGVFDDPTDPNTAFFGIGGSTYVLRWTISNAPCADSYDETIITFYQSPSPANAGPDQLGANMCGASSTILEANAPSIGTATWSVISGTGGSFSDIHDPLATFTGTPGETYTLRWTIGQIPCGVNYDEVNITFFLNPSPADAGQNQGGLDMCGLDQTTLEAIEPTIGSGSWAILNGNDGSISDLTDPTATLFGSNGATYSLLWTVSNGPCPVNTDTVEVHFTESPVPADAGEDMLNGALCGETSVTLAANNPGNDTGTWTILSGNGGAISESNNPASIFSGLPDETYQLLWTIDNGICPTENDTVQIHFDRSPSTAIVGPDQDGDAMCGITMAGIGANTPAYGTGVWSIENGTGGAISNPNNPSTLFTGLSGESYTLRWTISLDPCPSSYDELVVTFHPLPGPVDAGNDQQSAQLCGQTSTTLEAQTPSVGTGIWTIASGTGGSFEDVTDPHTIFYGNSGTSYELVWTVSSSPCNDLSDTVLITFPSLPTPSDAGQDQTGSELCGLSTTQLEANIPTIGSGEWSIVSGSGGNFEDPANPETVFNGINGNTYVLKWTISNAPCDVSEDLVTVHFPALPSIANGGTDFTGFQMCGLTSIQLQGESPQIGQGEWYLVEGDNGSFTNQSDPQTTFSGDPGGDYTLTWTTSNEGCSASIDTVNVTFENLPVAADAGPDQQICLNENTVLIGNDPGVDDALWLSSSDNIIISSSNEQETSLTATNPGIYEIVWAIGNGLCAVSADTMVVEVLAIPQIEAGVDSSICGNTIQLYGITDTSSSGMWSSDNEDLLFEDIFNAESMVSELTEGENVLIWEATDGICTATDSVVITSHTPWVADAGVDQSVCGLEAQLNAIPQSGNGNWSSSNASDFWPNSSAPDATVTANLYGSFTFTWTETDGVCTSSDEINITFWQEVDEANAGEDQTLTDEYSTVISANNPLVGEGQWSSLNNEIIITDSLAFTTEVFGLPYGTTTLTWTITNGVCQSSSDDIVIIVNQSELPTGFSPNNDGSNDFFEIRGLSQMSDTRLTVFDRWGNIVFDMEDYDNSWDGTSSNGDILTDDTYFYTFQKDGIEISSYVVIRR